MKHKTCILSLTLITLGMSLTTLEAQNTPFYSVKDYGAVADGQTKDTEAIAKAIDAASQAGGGTIYFQSGTYLTGPIHLKSNITLYVDAGATVKFSTDYADYVPMVKSRWEGLECMNFSPPDLRLPSREHHHHRSRHHRWSRPCLVVYGPIRSQQNRSLVQGLRSSE